MKNKDLIKSNIEEAKEQLEEIISDLEKKDNRGQIRDFANIRRNCDLTRLTLRFILQPR